MVPHLASGEAERRHLTVVFADLVGSTELGSRLDPEDLRDVMGAWRDCTSALVTRFGGLVTRHMGDGILAFFGYPRAHEADAERAVRAGLAIIEAAGRLDTIAGPQGTLTTRVGIATGLVIVGDLIGAGSSLEWSVVGETPNLAARLQALAKPDTVLIDEATRKSIGEIFECTALGPVQLRGIPLPASPSIVLRESAARSRFEALRIGPFPLVGREEEASLLERRWIKARSGSGQVVAIVGEPGLGKSRLIAEFEQRLGGIPRSVLRLACSPHFQDTPLYPVIRYFESAAGFDRSDSPGDRLAKLQQLFQDVGGHGEVELDSLADLLSISSPAKARAHQTPQVTKELIFQAVIHHIRALATRTPLLAIVEDLHWADPTTSVLLDSMVSRVEELPALIIISSRPEREIPWSIHPHVNTVRLNGLDRIQAAALVQHVSGGRKLADELVGRIVERAAGVPLFLEELTRSLISSGLWDQTNTMSSRASSPIADAIPTSLKALLAARLDQLGSGKEVAQASSVIGREFSFEALRAVSRLPRDRLTDALRELEQAGMIMPGGPPPNATYVFHHVLIQEAAYASMVRERRWGFHLRYAETLEEDAAGLASTAPELAAAHFAAGGAAEKSIHYYLKAAARATGRFALPEIAGYLQKGLAQLKLLPPTESTQHRELELLVARGRALMEHHGAGNEEVRTTFERAHELCLILGDTKLLLHVHDGLANYYLAHSDLGAVVECGARALEVGRRTGDHHAIVLAHRSRGHASLLLGRFREARDDLEQVLSQYKGEMAITRDPKVSAYGALGICLTALGLADSGTSMSIAAVHHAEALMHPISLNLGLRRACIQAMMRRDAHSVIELSARLLNNQSDFETFRGRREGEFFSAWGHLQINYDPELCGRLLGIVDYFESVRLFNFLPFFMLAAAELTEVNGDHESTDVLLHRAAEMIETTNERWCEAEIARLRARRTGDPETASELLQTSLSLARNQGALLWELRSTMDFAKLLRSYGKTDLAFSSLAPVLAQFREGLTMPDVSASGELLRQLAAESAAPTNANHAEEQHA